MEAAVFLPKHNYRPIQLHDIESQKKVVFVCK